ncbi:hypothetical protein BHYA_0158g00250 [Botrytis hyacinthi]|uniref:Uncharacterized protein n=1 Tax=Botrytis hyacinthi TaxID=278943 RepID=A0A4Z1GNV9_9HELO|nr:hypothetical protein BHYA_0158g00250 [Botrytis hyacinthi]
MPRLEKIAKNSRAVKETCDSNHSMNIDLQNIIKAWDSYIQEGGLNLPSTKASRDVYNKQHGHAKHGTKAKFLGWKKPWILEKRQKEREEASRSSPDSPLLGCLPDVDDPFADPVENGQFSRQTRVSSIQNLSSFEKIPFSNAQSYGSPANTSTDSQERFVVNDSYKFDIQDVHGSTQKVISPNVLDQTQDILFRDNFERTSKVIIQAYDMFSDDDIEGADDDKVPQYEESAGLQSVDTVNAAINNVEELWDDYE